MTELRSDEEDGSAFPSLSSSLSLFLISSRNFWDPLPQQAIKLDPCGPGRTVQEMRELVSLRATELSVISDDKSRGRHAGVLIAPCSPKLEGNCSEGHSFPVKD